MTTDQMMEVHVAEGHDLDLSFGCPVCVAGAVYAQIEDLDRSEALTVLREIVADLERGVR